MSRAAQLVAEAAKEHRVIPRQLRRTEGVSMSNWLEVEHEQEPVTEPVADTATPTREESPMAAAKTTTKRKRATKKAATKPTKTTKAKTAPIAGGVFLNVKVEKGVKAALLALKKKQGGSINELVNNILKQALL